MKTLIKKNLYYENNFAGEIEAIESFLKKNYKEIKEMSLFRYLKKEVETGASGTQDYVIKKGPNKDKIAKK